MMYLKLIFFISVFHPGELIFPNKFKKPNKIQNFASVSEMMIEISKTCYKNYSIFIYNNGHLRDIHLDLFKNLHSAGISVVSMDSMKLHKDKQLSGKMIEYRDIFTEPEHKLLIFTYMENEFLKVQSTFDAVTMRRFPYFVIYLRDKNCDGIDWASFVLWLRYENLYYYICTNSDGKLMVFTMNRYSPRAPDSWEYLKTMEHDVRNSIMEHLFLFSRRYNKDTICHGLKFDPTKSLNGYPLKVHIFKNDLATWPDENALFYFNEKHPEALNYMTNNTISQLNQLKDAFKVKVEGYVTGSSLKMIRSMHEDEYIGRVKLDLILMRITAKTDERIKKVDYPTDAIAVHIMTHHKGFMTPIEKIADFYGTWIIILYTVFILVAAFVVIWWIERRLSLAGFEILRLLIGSELRTPMTTVSRRMFFCFIFLYFLIISATLNGNLVKSLTQFKERKHPTSLKDLEDPQYTKIYIQGTAVGYFGRSPFEKLHDKAFLADSKSCMDRMLAEPASVCIARRDDARNALYEKALKLNKTYNIFYSRHPIGYMDIYNGIRFDSLLFDRIKLFSMYQTEYGIGNLFEKLDTWYVDYVYNQKAALNEKKFVALKLKDLAFAFIFLGFGLTCASVTFIAELYIRSDGGIWQFVKKTLFKERPKVGRVIIVKPAALQQ